MNSTFERYQRYFSFFQANFRYIFTFAVIAYSHHFILINEEVLVAFCFACAILFLYSNMGEAVTESLNERADGIRKDLSTFLLLKQEHLKELREYEERLLNTEQNVKILQAYSEKHIVLLNQNQEKALAGLVANNLVNRLQALKFVQKSLQPVLHKQMNISFREAVLEDFKSGDKMLQSIDECFGKIKEL